MCDSENKIYILRERSGWEENYSKWTAGEQSEYIVGQSQYINTIYNSPAQTSTTIYSLVTASGCVCCQRLSS